MTKVAIIETKPSRVNYRQEFEDIPFDLYQLCSDSSIKKVLKKDVDIQINIDEYDWVILVGSEPVKMYLKGVSVMDFSGKRVNNKFLPVINPAMLTFKPEIKTLWEKSKTDILAYIRGEVEETTILPSMVQGIQDSEDALRFIEEAIAHEGKEVGLDSETAALYPREGQMLGLSLSYDNKNAAYIDADCIDEKCEERLQYLFDKKEVVFHNAKFDLAFFEYHFNFRFPVFHDTMLMHYLLDENPGNHGLKQLAIKHTKYGDYEKPLYEWIEKYLKSHGLLKSDFRWSSIPFEVMTPYAAMDSLVTLELFKKFKILQKNQKLWSVYTNILIPGCRFLTDIQDNGVPFHRKRLQFSQNLMQLEIDQAIAALYENPKISRFEEIQGKPFNPNSTLQLRKLLFDHLGLTPTGKKTGTNADSTDAEVLGLLAEKSEVPGLILDIRKKSKIKNTYLDKIIPALDSDGRLRTNFNLHGTTSGRLSSSGKLNMQQLPRDNPIVKGCIKAKAGYKIVAMD